MRIILAGFGSVGRAFARLIEARREELYHASGLAPRLVAVIDSRSAARAEGPSSLAASDLIAAKEATGAVGAAPAAAAPLDAARIIREAAADVLVEASPSSVADPAPALAHIRAALGSGKHVVTVNKAPIALALPALAELARFNAVHLRYSGTVGAGTPVLATARTLAAGDRITRVRSILNGTTNFILWRMGTHSDTYGAALKEAIRLGYAETDPSADVDGIDTAVKVVILANTLLAASGASIPMSAVRIQGIRDISRASIDSARADGHATKLIGEIDLAGPVPALSVSPQRVRLGDPLDVPESLNAVQFTLANSGTTTLTGGGAGGTHTATAILRDIVAIWNSSPH